MELTVGALPVTEENTPQPPEIPAVGSVDFVGPQVVLVGEEGALIFGLGNGCTRCEIAVLPVNWRLPFESTMALV